MIDLHSHYLFGVDDGARTLKDSLDMLRTASADGVLTMVATPHQRHPAGYDVPVKLARSRFAEVREAAEREGIGVELALAAEIHFSSGLTEGLSSGELLPLGEGSRYFLLELPVTTVPGNLGEVVFAFQTAGWFPVLAHPERNFEVIENPGIALHLHEQGVPLQLTAQSILGEFGKKIERASKKLLKWGAVDVIASDAHNPTRRPPGLSRAVDRAARWVGAERAERMVTEAPARILAGLEVPG